MRATPVETEGLEEENIGSKVSGRSGLRWAMATPNLAAVDLNLLVVFEALLIERNVSRAAGRVGLAQPSVSNALARLRTLFGDALFIRAP